MSLSQTGPLLVGLAGPPSEEDLGELSEQIAAWIFRGLKLIKELFLAFISLYLPAIYMLMQALPLRMRKVSAPGILCKKTAGKWDERCFMYLYCVPVDRERCAHSNALDVSDVVFFFFFNISWRVCEVDLSFLH